MLALSYADDISKIHFQKLIGFVKANQKNEDFRDRKLLPESKKSQSELIKDNARPQTPIDSTRPRIEVPNDS